MFIAKNGMVLKNAAANMVDLIIPESSRKKSQASQASHKWANHEDSIGH